jgi:putative transposase
MLAFLAAIRIFFRTRLDISLEVLALRQQVAVLKRKRPRPSLNRLDRFFWTTLRQIWPRWSEVLVIVKPETVVGWHRAGFRLYWRWRSRPRGGRPKVSEEIRTLVRRMAAENSGWGAPKLHGKLLSSASRSPSVPSPDICNACGDEAILPNIGSPSSLTIAR